MDKAYEALQLIKQAFPGGKEDHEDHHIGYNVTKHGRTIHFTIVEDSVMIEFQWVGSHPEDSDRYQTAVTLQPGTFRLKTELIAIAKQLKQLGMRVDYFANPRRSKVYDKAMTRQGFRKTQDSIIQSWEHWLESHDNDLQSI